MEEPSGLDTILLEGQRWKGPNREKKETASFLEINRSLGWETESIGGAVGMGSSVRTL
jgi:hypothetical protein